MWGYSSVGRAPALQAGGQEFESLYLHHGILKSHITKLYIENYIMNDNDKYRDKQNRGNKYLKLTYKRLYESYN